MLQPTLLWFSFAFLSFNPLDTCNRIFIYLDIKTETGLKNVQEKTYLSLFDKAQNNLTKRRRQK